MRSLPDDTTGLILSGGGAYAAYEVGVVRALVAGQSPATGYKPVTPEVIAGISAGAFNGAVLTSSICNLGAVESVDRLADIWLDDLSEINDLCGNGLFRLRANVFDAFGLACMREPFTTRLAKLESDIAYLGGDALGRTKQFFDPELSLQQRLTELVDVATFISTDPLREVMHQRIRLENLRNSPVRFVVGATNWRTGLLRNFPNEEMTDRQGYRILRASAAIPGLFQPVDVDGDPYVDGGLVMNTPLKTAIDAGADILHIIYINPAVVKIPLPRVRNTVNALFRSLFIGLAGGANDDIETARRVNQALALFKKDDLGESKPPSHALSGIPRLLRHFIQGMPSYRPLTIHRYYPRELVGGMYQWLTFDRDHILELIQQGYGDALAHDCAVNGCVLPEGGVDD